MNKIKLFADTMGEVMFYTLWGILTIVASGFIIALLILFFIALPKTAISSLVFWLVASFIVHRIKYK